MRYLTIPAIALSAFVFCSTAIAQHDHGDIEFGYEGGALVIEGGPLFEGDFDDLAGGPDATNAPGFVNASDEGLTIGADEIVGYRAVRPLSYHDGAGFSPTTATLTIENAIGADVGVSASSFGDVGYIAQADGSGNFHAHVDFSISPSAPVGAYGLYLELLTYDSGLAPTGVPASDPFLIVFNRGLDEATFEAAAEGAFASTIPEPAGLSLIGLAALGLVRRRSGENR